MKFVNQKSLFKIIGASALATCMLATSLFVFIPNSTQAETLNSNQNSSITQSVTSTTEQTGLITPRADDPVLFTTESGLEIKYGNATLSSGPLSGWPYFTTQKNTSTYTWVVIGSRYYDRAYLNNQDPALHAITKDWRSVLRSTTTNVPLTVIHEEIPIGCWLVLLNSGYGSVSWSTMQEQAWSYGVQPYINTQVTNDTWGLNALLPYICNTTVTGLYDRYKDIKTATTKLFPLDYSDSGQNFLLSSYLSSEYWVSSNSLSYFLRSNTYINHDYGQPAIITELGNCTWAYYGSNYKYSVRPAFVINANALFVSM